MTRAMMLGATASLLLLVACGDDTSGTDGTGTGGTGTGGTTAGGGGAGGALPDGSCREDADCEADQEYCIPKEAIMGCGACYTPDLPCQSDDECSAQGEHYICEIPSCGCDATKECRAGCLDEQSCGDAQICGADHRCAAQPCSDAAPCPDDFECGNSTSTCARRHCQSDADCEGFCVFYQCYDQLGTCEPPAA